MCRFMFIVRIKANASHLRGLPCKIDPLQRQEAQAATHGASTQAQRSRTSHLDRETRGRPLGPARGIVRQETVSFRPLTD